VLNLVKNVDARKNTFLRMAGSGLWTTSTLNLTFTENFVAWSRRITDSCTNHIDIQTDDSIFEKNIGYKNEGGFFESMGLSDNNVVRYCVSVDDGQEDLGDGERSHHANSVFLTGYTAAPKGTNYRVAPTNITMNNNLLASTASATQYWRILDKPTGIVVANNQFIVGQGKIELIDDSTKYDHAAITGHANLVGGDEAALEKFEGIMTASDTARVDATTSDSYAQGFADVITSYLDNTHGSMLSYDELKDRLCALSEPTAVALAKSKMSAYPVNVPLYTSQLPPSTVDFCGKSVQGNIIGPIQGNA